MVMMENFLLVSIQDLSMKNIKKYCGRKQSQSDLDQSEAYYQAVGGEKKRRIYGLGAEAKSYYGTNLCASSSVPPSVSQSTPITNLDEFVKQLIPALTNHFLPIVIE